MNPDHSRRCELGALKGMTGGWEGPQLIFLSTFLELVQTGLMDVRHDSFLKLAPCSETWGEFLAVVLVLCGAGRERQRSGEHVCIHHLAKPPGSTEEELLTGLPQVIELGLQKLLIFVANNWNYLGGKMVLKHSLVFFLIKILKWSFIYKKYFLSKREKNTISTKQLFLYPSVQTSRFFF